MYLEETLRKGGIDIPIKDTIKFLLNLEESQITTFEQLENKNNELNYLLILSKVNELCPCCKGFNTIIKDYRTNTINIDLIYGKACNIVFKRRRFWRKDCGKYFLESNPLKFKKHRIANSTIMNIMKELKDYHATFSKVGKDHHLSTTTVIKVFDSMLPNVKRVKLPTVLGINEVHMPIVLYKSKYICVMMDIMDNDLIEVLPSRKKYDLYRYFERIPLKERDKVLYFSCDMYDTYINAAIKYLKNAKICIDPFHVVERVIKAIDNVRIQIEHDLKSDKKARYLFNKFRWLFTKFNVELCGEARFNRVLNRYLNYGDILNLMLGYDERLEIAYNLMSSYIVLNQTASSIDASERINAYIQRCIQSKLFEFTKLASTLINYKEFIINSFDRYYGKRVTNASMESLNGRIDKLKDNANGYKNFDRFRIRAIYCFNKKITFTLNEDYSSNSYKIK